MFKDPKNESLFNYSEIKEKVRERKKDIAKIDEDLGWCSQEIKNVEQEIASLENNSEISENEKLELRFKLQEDMAKLTKTKELAQKARASTIETLRLALAVDKAMRQKLIEDENLDNLLDEDWEERRKRLN